MRGECHTEPSTVHYLTEVTTVTPDGHRITALTPNESKESATRLVFVRPNSQEGRLTVDNMAWTPRRNAVFFFINSGNLFYIFFLSFFLAMANHSTLQKFYTVDTQVRYVEEI